jgi:hypothetical protein
MATTKTTAAPRSSGDISADISALKENLEKLGAVFRDVQAQIPRAADAARRGGTDAKGELARLRDQEQALARERSDVEDAIQGASQNLEEARAREAEERNAAKQAQLEVDVELLLSTVDPDIEQAAAYLLLRLQERSQTLARIQQTGLVDPYTTSRLDGQDVMASAMQAMGLQSLVSRYFRFFGSGHPFRHNDAELLNFLRKPRRGATPKAVLIEGPPKEVAANDTRLERAFKPRWLPFPTHRENMTEV